MKKIDYDNLGETLYHEKLNNGLNVFLMPKTGFNKTYAIFTTNYGSSDNNFVPIGEEQMVDVPHGIAHFLEHKLFEQKEGDVFFDFATNGASANAYTSFDRTAYLFSCTDNLQINLETLLDFVQNPYFTDENVEKEKGIIGQEIKMYDDDPGSRLFYGILDNLYQVDPIRIPILGTIDTINKIDRDLLYTCYKTFYNPANMVLFIVGNFDPEKIIKVVRDNQGNKDFPEISANIKRHQEIEPAGVSKEHAEIKMDVNIPNVAVGVKIIGSESDIVRRKITINLGLNMLFSSSSNNYEKLLAAEVINDTFDFGYLDSRNSAFIMIDTDSDKPHEFIKQIKNSLLNLNEVTKEDFEREKKSMIIKNLSMFDNIENIASAFTSNYLLGINIFDKISEIEKINYEDVIRDFTELIKPENMTSYIINPKS